MLKWKLKGYHSSSFKSSNLTVKKTKQFFSRVWEARIWEATWEIWEEIWAITWEDPWEVSRNVDFTIFIFTPAKDKNSMTSLKCQS